MRTDFHTAMDRIRRLPYALILDAAREDQDRRWAAGERVVAEEYFSALPILASRPEDAVVLVYGEILCRTARDEAIHTLDFLSRFPDLATRLEPILEVHAGLNEGIGFEHEFDSSPSVSDSMPPSIPGLGPLTLHARGGMGQVYRAVDLASGRPVATKVVESEEATPETLVRFLQEGEILARLIHPNIVRILRCGSHTGGLHLVTEWVGGGTLEQYCGQRHAPAAAAGLVAVVADAVEYAHSRGVIHRDLKPANFLLEEPGNAGRGASESNARARSLSSLIPKVADFGIARLLAVGRAVTATGEVLGTASFMPPEQVRGLHHLVGPATDVYALGATLYTLLTGTVPFEGRNAIEVVQKVVADEPVAPSVLVPNLHDDMNAICLRCLAKRPEERYPSARALSIELREFTSRSTAGTS